MLAVPFRANHGAVVAAQHFLKVLKWPSLSLVLGTSKSKTTAHVALVQKVQLGLQNLLPSERCTGHEGMGTSSLNITCNIIVFIVIIIAFFVLFIGGRGWWIMTEKTNVFFSYKGLPI